MSPDLQIVIGRKSSMWDWYILHPDGSVLDKKAGYASSEEAIEAAAQQSKDKLTGEADK
jgi:hypothetical protein